MYDVSNDKTTTGAETDTLTITNINRDCNDHIVTINTDAAEGTLAFSAIPRMGDTYEALLLDDAAFVLDVAAGVFTFQIEDQPIQALKVVPTSLDGTELSMFVSSK